jgi:hypothetical protein
VAFAAAGVASAAPLTASGTPLPGG